MYFSPFEQLAVFLSKFWLILIVLYFLCRIVCHPAASRKSTAGTMHKKSDRKLKNLRMAPSSGGKISSKQRKLVPNGAGTEDTAVSRAQGNLTHQKKFTTCNIFSICCIILTAITSSLMYFGLQRTTGHQPQHWASLQHNFSVDYDEIMANRQQSMARHRNNYSTFGIDRRHGLSLEEFFDVYDGKWWEFNLYPIRAEGVVWNSLLMTIALHDGILGNAEVRRTKLVARNSPRSAAVWCRTLCRASENRKT